MFDKQQLTEERRKVSNANGSLQQKRIHLFYQQTQNASNSESIKHLRDEWETRQKQRATPFNSRIWVKSTWNEASSYCGLFGMSALFFLSFLHNILTFKLFITCTWSFIGICYNFIVVMFIGAHECSIPLCSMH